MSRVSVSEGCVAPVSSSVFRARPPFSAAPALCPVVTARECTATSRVLNLCPKLMNDGSSARIPLPCCTRPSLVDLVSCSGHMPLLSWSAVAPFRRILLETVGGETGGDGEALPRKAERELCPSRAPLCGALPRSRLTSRHTLPPVACSVASITGVGLAVSADEAKVAVGVVLEMSEIDGHPELEPRRGVLCLTAVGEGALSALSL